MIDQAFLKDVAQILLQADRQIITPALQSRQADIEAKGFMYGETDFVTSIDKNAEEFLLAELSALIPNTYAVGEETFDLDRDTHIAGLSSGYAWIVDPLDGTNNVKKYVVGETDAAPRYGVMAALLKDGTPVAGWILACHGAKKKLACGSALTGAFFYDHIHNQLNAFVLATPDKPIKDFLLVTTVKAFPQDYQDIINANIAAGKVTIFDPPPKSAAHELMHVLDGTADAAPFRQFRVWDHFPGLAIVRAAGGYARLLNGEEPTLADQRKKRHFICLGRQELAGHSAELSG